jgi:hypothetical protein
MLIVNNLTIDKNTFTAVHLLDEQLSTLCEPLRFPLRLSAGNDDAGNPANPSFTAAQPGNQ